MPGINGTANGSTTNGSTAYGKVAVDKIIKDEHKPSAPGQTSEDDLQLVLQNFRLLIADLCQQFGMGEFFLTTAICIQPLNKLVQDIPVAL